MQAYNNKKFPTVERLDQYYTYTSKKPWHAYYKPCKRTITKNCPQWNAWINTTPILGKKFRYAYYLSLYLSRINAWLLL